MILSCTLAVACIILFICFAKACHDWHDEREKRRTVESTLERWKNSLGAEQKHNLLLQQKLTAARSEISGLQIEVRAWEEKAQRIAEIASCGRLNTVDGHLREFVKRAVNASSPETPSTPKAG